MSRFAWLAVSMLSAGLATDGLAQDPAAELAALNARAAKLGPEDYKFMQPVCTRCHTPEMFLHSHSWSEWRSIFSQMNGYGAVATQEQWDHIYRFVQRGLTQIDVNHADEEELSAVLGVDEKTAIAMVRRRADREFESAEDVEAMPGVDKALIELIKPRLLFDRLRADQ